MTLCSWYLCDMWLHCPRIRKTKAHMRSDTGGSICRYEEHLFRTENENRVVLFPIELDEPLNHVRQNKQNHLVQDTKCVALS